MIHTRNVLITDLDQLLTLENEGFSQEEAATKQAFIDRINMIPDTFLVAELEGTIIGYVNGPIINQHYITDDLFERTKRNQISGGFQSILGLVVSKQVRNQGVARLLMKKIHALAIEHKRAGITLTCKQELVPFYEKLGFENHGISDSNHGGIRWYNMVQTIDR